MFVFFPYIIFFLNVSQILNYILAADFMDDSPELLGIPFLELVSREVLMGFWLHPYFC